MSIPAANSTICLTPAFQEAESRKSSKKRVGTPCGPAMRSPRFRPVQRRPDHRSDIGALTLTSSRHGHLSRGLCHRVHGQRCRICLKRVRRVFESTYTITPLDTRIQGRIAPLRRLPWILYATLREGVMAERKPLTRRSFRPLAKVLRPIGSRAFWQNDHRLIIRRRIF